MIHGCCNEIWWKEWCTTPKVKSLKALQLLPWVQLLTLRKAGHHAVKLHKHPCGGGTKAPGQYELPIHMRVPSWKWILQTWLNLQESKMIAKTADYNPVENHKWDLSLSQFLVHRHHDPINPCGPNLNGLLLHLTLPTHVHVHVHTHTHLCSHTARILITAPGRCKTHPGGY